MYWGLYNLLSMHGWSEAKPAEKSCGNPARALTPPPIISLKTESPHFCLRHPTKPQHPPVQPLCCSWDISNEVEQWKQWWRYYEDIIQISWRYSEDIMKISWRYYEDIMKIFWRFHESDKPSASPDRLLLGDRPTLVFVDLFENPLDLLLTHLIIHLS